MRELSMHILDLVQNSIVANASLIEIKVIADTKSDFLKISITDDGKGMSPEFLAKATDPFTTTRTTRRVGLGIPMFAESAKAAGGSLCLESKLGKGTSIKARFKIRHIDRAPLGNITDTLKCLIAANPDIRFIYTQKLDSKKIQIDTDEIKSKLNGVPINYPEVLAWLSEYIKEQTAGLSV